MTAKTKPPRNPERTQDDIKTIVVDTLFPGIAGWAVTIIYKDGKRCAFSIDWHATLNDEKADMLQATTDAIKRQLKSVQRG